MKHIILAALAALSVLLAACATNGGSPKQSIAQATNAYNASAQTILAYKKLAPCGSPNATQLCSDPAVVAQLKVADDAAYRALVAAEAAVNAGKPDADTLIAAANAAAQSLSALTAQVQR